MSKCVSKQYSDSMVCECGNKWDVNDQDPPKCKMRQLNSSEEDSSFISIVDNSYELQPGIYDINGETVVISATDKDAQIAALEAQIKEMRLDWADAEKRLYEKYAKSLIKRNELKAEVEYWRKDSAAAWDKCEERRQDNVELRELCREMLEAFEDLVNEYEPNKKYWASKTVDCIEKADAICRAALKE